MNTYTFTNLNNGKYLLRTKSDTPLELVPGFQHIKNCLSDCDIIHSFNLVTKIKEEQVNKIYYSWYEVDNYSYEIDRTTLFTQQNESIINLENAILELADIIGG